MVSCILKAIGSSVSGTSVRSLTFRILSPFLALNFFEFARIDGSSSVSLKVSELKGSSISSSMLYLTCFLFHKLL